jgi:hypothetical protein
MSVERLLRASHCALPSSIRRGRRTVRKNEGTFNPSLTTPEPLRGARMRGIRDRKSYSDS